MTLTATRGVGLGVLGELAAGRREDIASELDGRTQHDLTRAAMGAPPARDATRPLLRPGLHLIAEIKRRSPSAGALAGTDEDLVTRARAYERGGAAAVSVLVEPRRFGGSLDDLRLVCDATRLPVLAKDFVVDRRQLALLRAAGADLVLLLAALHSSTALSALVREARELGLEPLVEAHDRRELERALRTDARIIGINNRDLGNLQVDPENAARLRALVPDDRLVVAESGIRSADAVRPLRALGFDGVLVGEALMRARCDPSTLAAEAARYVAAGRQPDETADPAAADRRATVKICGVTTRAGMLAAVRAGADAVGLNLVPTSRRCVTEAEARELIVAAREASGRPPRMVGILADAPLDEARRLVRTLELDAVQLCGSEGSGYGADIPCSVLKVLRLPAASSAEGSPTPEAVLRVADAISRGPVWAELVLDVAGSAGGSGQRVDAGLARAVASRVPVHLAGGLTAANVAAVLREIPAVGVDVATGVEREGGQAAGSRPDKDPFLVELFVKRAHAARLDLPAMPARASAVPGSLLEADPTGRWGVDRAFGGRYVPETLYGALAELEEMYRAVRDDPCFWSELRDLGRHFVGRPSALYRADRLAAALTTAVDRAPDAVRLFLKREDLNHTGAHKINNAIGQALLALRLGKRRVIAETGAGQHGVATASACALLGLPCVVYMGAADVERQAANVVRMRALGAEVRSVTDGSATLKDAINEAMRDWVTNVRETHYVLGSAVGPHPYPTIVRDLQRVIGDEAAAQCRTIEGRLPDLVIACVGGGSNALGLFSRFIGEPAVRLVAVEAGGEGLDSARHAAALAAGSVGVLHGARSFLLQDPDGQVLEPHSISAGLDYPGVGPQLSALHAAGRLEIRTSTDDEAIAAFEVLARTEGILPALEPAHAIAALGRLLAENAAPYLPDGSIVLLGLSGRGDKDLGLVTPVGAMEVVA